ncbi:MAG: hypothetical protein IKI60_03350 [Alloprevotella sp.]|nr:hypothetical protein [Alloprevotella sp.]
MAFTLTSCGDDAQMSRGGNWRTPSLEQIEELIKKARIYNSITPHRREDISLRGDFFSV